MRNHVGALVGTNDLDELVLDLLTRSLAPATYNNYGTGMRCFNVYCNEEGITSLQATAADMLRFTTWLARSGTIAANSLQPYFSAINKFFRDHLKEPVALGPLLTDARRGLAMQQQPITDPDIRVPIHVPIVQKMLLFAHRHYRALT
jgi:site-specific recombinase XerC